MNLCFILTTAKFNSISVSVEVMERLLPTTVARSWPVLLEKGLLLSAAVGDVLEGFHGAGHLTHFNEGVDDGKGGLGGTGRLQNGGEHVKSSLGEGMIGDGMLHRLEPVEIFDQLLSLCLLQGETVTRRKLVGIVPDCLNDTFGLYAI